MVTEGALTRTMFGIWKLAGMPSWMTGGSMMGCTGCDMMMFGCYSCGTWLESWLQFRYARA